MNCTFLVLFYPGLPFTWIKGRSLASWLVRYSSVSHAATGVIIKLAT